MQHNMKNPNLHHVATAEQALKSVYDAVDEKAVANLLADMRHLCDARRIDYCKLDRRAYRAYESDMAGGP